MSAFPFVVDFGVGQICIRNPVVSEGGRGEFDCIVLRTEHQKTLFMYLCKDGIGVHTEPVQDNGTAHFTVTQFTKEDSGRYSCVYSVKRHPFTSVRATNENAAIIYVTGDALPLIH